MHYAESKDKLEVSAVKPKVQTPCSAVIQCDPHSSYTQQSLPSEAVRWISCYCHFGRHSPPFELRRIRAGRNASVSSALEGPVGSSCSASQGDNGDGRSQDARVAGFSKPLFKVTADTVDSLNLVIGHEPLFPAAERRNCQKHSESVSALTRNRSMGRHSSACRSQF